MKLFIALYLLSVFVLGTKSVLAEPIKFRDSSGKEIGRYEKSSAFIVLAGYYNSAWTPVSGLKEFKNTLKSTLEKLDFDVVTLLDPKGKEFNQAFLDFFNNYGRYLNSRVLIYFAGHCGGIKTTYGNGSDEYLIPSDAPDLKKNPIWFRENALSFYRLDHYLRKLGAKHVLSIFEGCSKGFSLEKNIKINMGPLMASKFKPSREIIFINASNQEMEKFRKGLIDALKGEGDLTGDGFLTTIELVNYLNRVAFKGFFGKPKILYGKLEGYSHNDGTLVFPLSSLKKIVNVEMKLGLQKKMSIDRINDELSSERFFSKKSETILNWPHEMENIPSRSPIMEETIPGTNEVVAFENPETLY